jgi:hypothetical protein
MWAVPLIGSCDVGMWSALGGVGGCSGARCGHDCGQIGVHLADAEVLPQ